MIALAAMVFMGAAALLVYGLSLVVARPGQRMRGFKTACAAIAAGTIVPAALLLHSFPADLTPEEAELAAIAADQGEDAAEAERAARALREAEACRQSLRCWAEAHESAATVRCQRAIERAPQFQMRWTDSWLERKFTHFRWADQDRGHLTFIGDHAEFQNAFGAWAGVIYQCDYDPEAEQVLDVRVGRGRLD